MWPSGDAGDVGAILHAETRGERVPEILETKVADIGAAECWPEHHAVVLARVERERSVDAWEELRRREGRARSTASGVASMGTVRVVPQRGGRWGSRVDS